MELKIIAVFCLSSCLGWKYHNIQSTSPFVLPIDEILEFTYSDFNCLHIRHDGSIFAYSVIRQIYEMKRWPMFIGQEFKTKYCYAKIFIAINLSTAKLLLKGTLAYYENRVLIIICGDRGRIYFNDLTNKADDILGHSEGLVASLGTNYTYRIRKQPSTVLVELEKLQGIWTKTEWGVTDFQGREIKLGASNCSFFTEIAPTGPNGAMRLSGGFDKELLVYIFKKLNLTYKIVSPPSGKIYSLLEEGDANSVIVRLAESRDIDVVSCGLTMTSLTNEIVDLTFPMIQVCYKLVVPRPRVKTSIWNVFWVFQPSLWALIATMIFAGALGLMYVARSQLTGKDLEWTVWVLEFNYERCCLEILSLILGSGTKTVRRKGLRIILIWWMILNVILSAGYSSLSIGFIMSSFRDKKIETISDLIDNDFYWISSYRVAVNRILDPETEPKTDEWGKRQVVVPADKMDKLLETRKYALLGTELQIKRIFIEMGGSSNALANYETASDCLNRCYLTVGFAKGSPFKRPVWKYIGRMNNGGLNKKIIDEIMYSLSLSSQYVYRLYEADHPISKKIPQKLTLTRVKGAFLVWGIGMTVALIVFIVEIKAKLREFGNRVVTWGKVHYVNTNEVR